MSHLPCRMAVSTILLVILSVAAAFAIPITHHPPHLSAITALIPSSSVRQWKQGGPCKRNDFVCMNEIALLYVNQIRAKVSRNPLSQGTESMLEVAMKHSKRMCRDLPARKKQKKFPVFHQDMAKTKLGCSSHFSGENVGQNFVGFGSRPTDPAKLCVTQFKKSKPHYKHLIHPRHEAVVMGVFIDKKNYIWCTQIFSVVSVFTKAGKCMKLKPWKGKSLKFSSRGHVFRKLSFVGRFPNGLVDKMILKCGAGHCKYCQQHGAKCLTEENSVKIDLKYFI